MKKKSLIASGFITLCVILGLSLNVIAEIEPTDRVVQIGNTDFGVFCGYAEVLSVDSDSVIKYEATNLRKKGCIIYCKDIVTWRVKDTRIIGVSVRQAKKGFIMNNTGIEKIEEASSESMCTIIAKHSVKVYEMLEGINLDYEYDCNDYWTIFSDGRYYIKSEY